MTVREIGEELLSYSREMLGSDLRAVTRYTRNEHDSIFIREDVSDQLDLDEDSRSMFRLPLVRMQKSAQELSQYHPTLDRPGAAVYWFGDITLLQLPITDTSGIVLTFDREGGLPDEYVSRCKSIASESE